MRHDEAQTGFFIDTPNTPRNLALHFDLASFRYRPLLRLLSKALASPNVLSGAVFGLSGLAFAVANLILAGVQLVEEYAVFLLVIAVMTLTSSMGLFGADGMVNRHTFTPDARMFGRILSTGLIAAVCAAVLLATTYEIDTSITVLLAIAVLAQAVIYFIAAFFQSRQEFRLSLFMFNSSNYVLLVVALIAIGMDWSTAYEPLALTTALLVMIAVFCSYNIMRRFRGIASDRKYSWYEAFAIISITGSASVMVQLERLVTPQLLGLNDLATLGVLLALVGPPFRLLQLSLGYVLLPKLRAARGTPDVKALIVRDMGIALALLVPSWLLVWYLVPIVDIYLFGDKYQFSPALMFSVIFAGTIKAVSGIARASVAALVSASDLTIMGMSGWIGVMVSIVCAVYGAQFGLAGIVYSVSVGWILRLIVAAFLVRKYVGVTG